MSQQDKMRAVVGIGYAIALIGMSLIFLSFAIFFCLLLYLFGVI